jgi:hypothetical protein
MVARLEIDVTRCDKTRGGFDRLRPAFEHDGAEHSPAHWTAHRVPRNRWTGVQNQLATRSHRWHHVARDGDVDEHRMGLQETRERDAVRAVDVGMAHELCERPRAVAIAERRRLPVDGDALAAGGGDVVAEAGKAHVDDGQRIFEQRLHRDGPSATASRAAIDTASMLLAATIAPVADSVRTCAARSCGSPSVPQT